jgi:hypothetical protein
MEIPVVQRFMLAWRAKKDAEAELNRRTNTPPPGADHE